MDRFWLITSTTYGTWLPGSKQGFVSPVEDEYGAYVIHNIPGTPYHAAMPALEEWSREQMRGKAILLSLDQAQALDAQFEETAAHRDWLLLAVAIMANHFHLVVGVPGDPNPEVLLRDFKSYGSRSLNRRWGKPVSGTWWTESGSKRKLPDEAAVLAAMQYVANQANPLVCWARFDLLEHRPASALTRVDLAAEDEATAPAGLHRPLAGSERTESSTHQPADADRSPNHAGRSPKRNA